MLCWFISQITKQFVVRIVFISEGSSTVTFKVDFKFYFDGWDNLWLRHQLFLFQYVKNQKQASVQTVAWMAQYWL